MKSKRWFLPILLACTMIVGSVAVFTQITPSAEESNIQSIQGIVGQFTEDEGANDATLYSITLDTAEMIDSEVAELREANLASDVDGNTYVEPRDWHRYSYGQATAYMTDAERQFYYRLDSLAECYANDSALDAAYVSTYGLYTMNGVQYGDLGLTSDQAFYVAEWFLYNNPGYYFMKPSFLTTSTAIYPAVHDIFADGDDKARTTNEIFGTVDAWICTISDTEVTAYEKEVAAHNLICDNLSYVKGTYDQSLYSAVIQRQTVCAGYSQLMTAMMNAVNVPTVTMFSSNHAWNKVLLDDGQYYAVDVTWDDTLSGTYLLNCNDVDIAKYDGKNEHVVPSEVIGYAPPTATLSMATHTTPKGEVGAPTNLWSEPLTKTSVRIHWDAAVNADYYELQAFSDFDCNNSLGYVQTKSCSAKLTGMTELVPLYVKVRACQGTTTDIVYSDWTPVFVATAVDPSTLNEQPTPSSQTIPTVDAPIGVHAEDVTDSSVRVVWTAPEKVSRYYIEVYTDSSMASLILGRSISSTSVKLSGLTAGESRYVRVRTDYDENGVTYQSGWSDLTITAGVSQQPEQPTPPSSSSDDTQDIQPVTTNTTIAVPNLVEVIDITETSGRTMWSLVDGAIGYYFEIATDGNFSNVLVGKLCGQNTIKLNIKGLSQGTTYYVRVKAVGDGCESDWVVRSFTTVSKVVFDAPASFTYEKVTNTSYRVKWSELTGINNYMLEIYSDANYSNLLISKATNAMSIKISGLIKGATYYVRVKGVYPGGNSEWKTLSFTVK